MTPHEILNDDDFKSRDITFQGESIELHYLGDYHPYHNGKNQNFDDFSSTILDFKKGEGYAITYFFDILSKKFEKITHETQLFCVPSHDPNNWSSMEYLIEHLVKQNETYLKNRSSNLIRDEKIDSLSKSNGKRSIDTHLNSISCDFNVRLLNNPYPHNVILLDDVCTTGSSLISCSQILKKNGYNNIFHVCLSKTSSSRNLELSKQGKDLIDVVISSEVSVDDKSVDDRFDDIDDDLPF